MNGERTGAGGKFASAWDEYAARSQPPPGGWPGDEWFGHCLVQYTLMLSSDNSRL